MLGQCSSSTTIAVITTSLAREPAKPGDLRQSTEEPLLEMPVHGLQRASSLLPDDHWGAAHLGQVIATKQLYYIIQKHQINDLNAM